MPAMAIYDGRSLIMSVSSWVGGGCVGVTFPRRATIFDKLRV